MNGCHLLTHIISLFCKLFSHDWLSWPFLSQFMEPPFLWIEKAFSLSNSNSSQWNFCFLYVCLCKYICVIAPLSVSRSGYLQEFCLLTLSKFTYGEKFSGISFVEIWGQPQSLIRFIKNISHTTQYPRYSSRM